MHIDALMQRCYDAHMRTTITLDELTHKALRMYAVQHGTSMSATIQELLHDALEDYIEDIEAMAIYEARKDEPTYPLRDVIKELKIDGIL